MQNKNPHKYLGHLWPPVYVLCSHLLSCVCLIHMHETVQPVLTGQRFQVSLQEATTALSAASVLTRLYSWICIHKEFTMYILGLNSSATACLFSECRVRECCVYNSDEEKQTRCTWSHSLLTHPVVLPICLLRLAYHGRLQVAIVLLANM